MNCKRTALFFVLVIIMTTSCSAKEKSSITKQIDSRYNLLPEKEIIISKDGSTYATYINPTTRYRHGILGDNVEAAGLLVVVDGIFYTLDLSDKYVFEDIKPRIYDVNNNGKLEIITIKTDVAKGAGIAIYEIVESGIKQYAYVSEIGIPHRWLNIVAIGKMEEKSNDTQLLWIQTPHIGGILKIANINKGEIKPIDQISSYSNHSMGEKNLSLSVLTKQDNKHIIYVPTQNGAKIVGFLYEEKKLKMFEEITQKVNFSKDLQSQYNFINIIQNGNN